MQPLHITPATQLARHESTTCSYAHAEMQATSCVDPPARAGGYQGAVRHSNTVRVEDDGLNRHLLRRHSLPQLPLRFEVGRERKKMEKENAVVSSMPTDQYTAPRHGTRKRFALSARSCKPAALYGASRAIATPPKKTWTCWRKNTGWWSIYGSTRPTPSATAASLCRHLRAAPRWASRV